MNISLFQNDIKSHFTYRAFNSSLCMKHSIGGGGIKIIKASNIYVRVSTFSSHLDLPENLSFLISIYPWFKNRCGLAELYNVSNHNSVQKPELLTDWLTAHLSVLSFHVFCLLQSALATRVLTCFSFLLCHSKWGHPFLDEIVPPFQQSISLLPLNTKLESPFLNCLPRTCSCLSLDVQLSTWKPPSACTAL